MSEVRYKLHPISAIINSVKGLKELIIPFVVIFFANGFNGGWLSLFPYLFIIGALLISLVTGIIKWKRFVYWFEDGELRIESGVFVKNKRYIPFERIQSLDYTEGILHRPFKLVKVKIETAGSDTKAEAELTAITREAADTIEKVMAVEKKRRDAAEEENVADSDAIEEEVQAEPLKPIYKISMKELLVLAATSSGIGVIFSGIAVVFSQFAEFIPYEFLYRELVDFIQFGILIVALAVFMFLLVAWGVSVIMTLHNYYEFSIFKEDEQLIITRGLLEKRKVTLPLKRIQGIRIIESPLRQPFGYSTVIVDSAGGSAGDEQKIKLFPLIKKKQAEKLMQEIFEDYNFVADYKTLPKRARVFYYRIDFFWLLPVIGLITYFFFPYGLFSLLLLPLIVLLGIMQHRTAGFAIGDEQVSFRYRTISKHTYFMKRKRIQSVEMRQSYFQRRKDLASIDATVKSGLLGETAAVLHLERKDAERIMEWYLPNTKKVKEESP